MDQNEVRALKALAVRIRIAVLDAIHSIGSGHLGGALSIADVMAALYGREMNIRVEEPAWPDRDKLVCSKGHAGPGVYGTLAVKGYFPYEELKTLNKNGTRLPSHCDRNKTPGIDVTTGSLGQGTSQAVGLALGDRLKGRKNRVFLIVGDGEMDEGQCWEAFAFAAAHKLSNLVVLIDWNKKQLVPLRRGPAHGRFRPEDGGFRFRRTGSEGERRGGHRSGPGTHAAGRRETLRHRPRHGERGGHPGGGEHPHEPQHARERREVREVDRRAQSGACSAGGLKL